MESTGNTSQLIRATRYPDAQRAENDYYASDPIAVDKLFAVEQFSDNIWEPACGEGHLSKRMIQFGKTVYSSDLIDRGYGIGGKDFLQANEIWTGDIITNPPYSLAEEFVRHANGIVTEGSKVAMLLRIQFLETKKRRELFRQFPPKTIFVFSERLKCARNGDFASTCSSATCYAWFVWEKGYMGEPVIKWI